MSDNYNWSGSWEPSESSGSSVPPPLWFTFNTKKPAPQTKKVEHVQSKDVARYDSRDEIRRMIRQELAELVHVEVPDAPPES